MKRSQITADEPLLAESSQNTAFDAKKRAYQKQQAVNNFTSQHAVAVSVFIGISLALLIWIADAAVDFLWRNPTETGFLSHLFPIHQPHELSLRLIILLAFSGGGIIAGNLLEKLINKTQEFQNNNENMNATLNSIGNAVVAIDLQGNVIRMNTEAEKLTGYHREEAFKKPVGEILQVPCISATEDSKKFTENILNTDFFSKKEETRLTSKDGTTYLVALSASPILDSHNKTKAVVLVFRDITEESRMRKTLAAREAKYRELFGSIADAVFLHDTEGYIREANKAACDYYGYTCNELIGKNIKELDTSPYFNKIPERLRKLHSFGETSFETMHNTASGKTINVAVKARLIELEGQPMVLSICRDVTAQKQSERQQHHLQQRLLAGLRAGDLAWWEMELPSGRVFFDKRKTEMLGYASNEFTFYTDFTNLIHPEDYEPTMQAMRNYLEGRTKIYKAEYRIKCKNGTYLWFRDAGTITENHKDGTKRIIGIVENIHRKKQAEEALQTSEEQLRTLIQGTPDLACFKDGKGRWLKANDATLDLLGLKNVDYIGKTDAELAEMTGKSQKVFLKSRLEADEKVWQMAKVERHEQVIQKTDGTVNTYDVLVSPVFNPDGSRKGLVVFGRDISRRKQEEEERRKSDTLKKEIIDTVNQGIIVYDREFRYVLWNRFMEKLTGLSAEEVSGQRAFEIFPHLQRQSVKNLLYRALEGETVNLHDTQFYVPNTGAFGWIAATYAPHRDACGNIIGVIASVSDITERKHIQQKIINTTINAEEKERNRIARKLHDGIGPLLSTIKLFTQTYIHSTDENYKKRIQDELLATIDEAIRDISFTSNSLSPQVVNDFGLAKALKKFAARVNKASSIDIKLHNRLVQRMSYENEITLYRVATELINNTLKHADATKIRIALDRIKNNIRMIYIDNGKGIDFEKYKNKQTESGLGLFTMHHRITSLQGNIEMKSKSGQGVSFVIFLPMTQ